VAIHRLTSYLAPTLRQDPADAEFPSHRLLLRAGFLRSLGAGMHSLLPLGLRVIQKIERILREEMNRVGGQEVLLPLTQPAELWRESGRWDEIGPEMLRFKDRGDRDMCLAMTHEETIVHLIRNDVQSYRQLPILLYQLQTKFRDEPRPRGGLIRTREFTMKDGYSFHEDEASLDEWYPRLYEAYERIFSRCGVDYVVVESDPGMMGGKTAHEFIAFSDYGEDTVVRCASCGYSANRQVARFARDPNAADEIKPVEEVATPGNETIEDVAKFLGVTPRDTAKAVFYYGEKRGLIFAVLRGDYQINETLLQRATGESALRVAHPEEIAACGAVAGYASPIGVKNAFVVADTSLERARNLVSGANREGYHLKNVNLGRDFKADVVAEIAAAEDGHACAQCGKPLAARRGIEVGNIFKLGTRYSAAMNATFQDRAGEQRPFVMGCYGIGSGRLMATVVEQSHDKDGIVWPETIAPFDCAIVIAHEDGLKRLPEVEAILEEAGIDALVDDRDLRPGVKFKDADLIGIPKRITLGRKIGEGIVEFRDRKTGTTEEIPIAELGMCVTAPRRG
jgi:prolyl-tRNA synthetase